MHVGNIVSFLFCIYRWQVEIFKSSSLTNLFFFSAVFLRLPKTWQLERLRADGRFHQFSREACDRREPY